MEIPVKKTKTESEKDKFELNVFNHKLAANDIAACGIDQDSFQAKNGFINEMISVIDDENNFVSQLAEKFENTFTPRELAYMSAKMAYVQMVNEFMAQGGNRAAPSNNAAENQIEETNDATVKEEGS